MRRNSISPEYKYIPINGTYNMTEKRSFFGSKMMDIEDSIVLDNSDIVYYQQLNGEQIDLTQELNLTSMIYSVSVDKENNHTFELDPSQSSEDKNGKTKWVTEINIKNVLRNLIYSKIKSNRTFEGVLNKNTDPKSVNESIYNYIDNNIIDRYQYNRVEFFVKYISLDDNNTQRFKTNFNYRIESKDNIFTDIRSIFTTDESNVRIFFTQEKDSKEYTFDYYFNIYFDKK
jgi:hypothetical protein